MSRDTAIEHDRNGNTPLHFVGQDVERAKKLLELGADPNAPNDDGDTPLHMMIDEDSPKIVELLIGAGADVNSKNRDGFTPLHNAVYALNPDMVLLLIQRGARVNEVDICGSTPLINLLADWDELNDPTTLIGEYRIFKSLIIAKCLLENGADHMVINHAGTNALDLVDSIADPNLIILFDSLKTPE